MEPSEEDQCPQQREAPYVISVIKVSGGARFGLNGPVQRGKRRHLIARRWVQICETGFCSILCERAIPLQ